MCNGEIKRTACNVSTGEIGMHDMHGKAKLPN